MLITQRILIDGREIAGAADLLEGMEPFAQEIRRFKAELTELAARPEYGCLSLPSEVSDLTLLASFARRIGESFTDVVVLGTGGSSLGAAAIYGLVREQTSIRESYPMLHFPENLGPHSMSSLLNDLDLGTTHFLVISKSGSTPETLAQLLVCLTNARKEIVADRVRDHFTVIVEPGDNPLRKLARKLDLSIYDHFSDLPGRYSVFSIVGLLPVMIAGLDVFAARKGARDYLSACREAPDIWQAPPLAASAALAFLAQDHGVSMSVLMPYDARLDDFSRWYQQLWGESLGKEGKGITPIRALGPVDQHSQLQLYLGGPADKFITVLSEDLSGLGALLDEELAREVGIDYLAGHKIGDLVGAEALAVVETLARNNRPVRELKVERLDEESLGALMMHFFLETLAMARVTGVNPFDQPAVEQGKQLTRDYLNNARGDNDGSDQ